MAKQAKQGGNRQPKERTETRAPADAPRPPIRIVGVFFALLLNLVLITLVSLLAGWLGWPRTGLLLGVVIAALLAGVLIARYVGARAGVHAFLGGMLSIPLLGFIALNGDWQVALYGGAFCAIGGLLMEKFFGAQKV